MHSEIKFGMMSLILPSWHDNPDFEAGRGLTPDPFVHFVLMGQTIQMAAAGRLCLV